MEAGLLGGCCGHSSHLLLACSFSLHRTNILKVNVKTRNKRSLICHIEYSCVWNCNLHFNVLVIPEKWHLRISCIIHEISRLCGLKIKVQVIIDNKGS